MKRDHPLKTMQGAATAGGVMAQEVFEQREIARILWEDVEWWWRVFWREWRTKRRREGRQTDKISDRRLKDPVRSDLS